MVCNSYGGVAVVLLHHYRKKKRLSVYSFTFHSNLTHLFALCASVILRYGYIVYFFSFTFTFVVAVIVVVETSTLQGNRHF